MPTIPVLVTFDRIGRNHTVPPMAATIDQDRGLATLADTLAAEVYRYARPHLTSRDVDVEVGLDDELRNTTPAAGANIGHGRISCGFHSGGRFEVTVAPTQEGL